MPFYLQARFIDNHTQECFYDEMHHKNICQLPSICSSISSWGILAPVLFLSSFYFSQDEELSMTSKVFITGMPFVIFGKNIIKNLRFDCCKRPPNEHFCKNKCTYGGFPSGHMAEAVYMAVLFGSRFGKKFALLLGAFAGFVGYSFLSCNRHYASQLIAGAALGTLYALAANKVIDTDLTKNRSFSLNFGATPSGGISVGVSYEF